MIAKILNSFFIGLIFVLLLDFLIFVGIKINYIDFYGIKEYYNTLFVDNQSYLLLIITSFIFGYLISNKKIFKIFAYIYVVLIIVSFGTLYKPIGYKIGSMVFKKSDLIFKIGNITFKGDLLYKGRKFTYIYRNDIKKVIKIKNKEDLN